MTEMSYQPNGDYLIPDLALEEVSQPLDKYGRMRKAYLKESRPLLFQSLLTAGKLYPHLLEIQQAARSRLDQMMPGLIAAEGVTEELKASDPMAWVARMNSLKAQAEEIILSELVYN